MIKSAGKKIDLGFSVSKPIAIYIYRDIDKIVPDLQDFLGNGKLDRYFTEPHFTLTENPDRADFFLFPFSVDPLFQKLGAEACRAFLKSLPHYSNHPAQHIFFMYDDQNLPLGLPSVIYRFTHDQHLREPNSITLPTLLNYGDSLFTPPHILAYHISFMGTLSTHFCRMQMIMPFLTPDEQNTLAAILPDINRLHNSKCDSESYQTISKQLKLKIKKLFPRVVENRNLKYYFNITFAQFRFLPEDERRCLFEKQKDIIQNSLLVLAPRGCGSYSIRFFEILAAGRIPVLIADNYLPPLNWLIDYDDFIFRIPQSQLLNIKQHIGEIFKQNSLAELHARCLKARKFWEEYLSPEKFSAFLHLTLEEVRKHNYNLNQIRI